MGLWEAPHYAQGGYVRGEGTSTSDSISARLSDGEFVLPADTVKSVGVKSLRDLVARTHEPTGRPARRGRYADGGMVTDDRDRKLNSFGDAAAAARDGSVAQISRSGNVMASPSNTFPGNQMQGDSGASGMAATQAARIAASSGASAQGDRGQGRGLPPGERERLIAQIPTDGYRATGPMTPDGSQDSWTNTEIGRNLSNLASALPGSAGAVVPLVARTGGAISGGISAATRLLTAGAGSTAASAAMGAEAAGPNVAQPAALARPADPMGSAVASTATASPSADTPAQPAQPGGAGGIRRIDRPGQSPLYTNLPDSSSDLQSFTARPAGGPSAQNMAAADALAGRQQDESMQRVQAAQYRAEVAARNSPDALRGRAIDALASRQLGSRRVAELLIGAASGMDTNATQRTRDAADAQRYTAADNLARQEFGLKQTAAGLQNRSAERLEAAQNDVAAARTPEQMRTARQRLLALSGKGEGRWKAVALQGGTDALGNKTDSILGAVDEFTGDMRRMGAQPTANQAPPDGTRVRGKDGRIYEVRGGQPVPVGN
jgi:hypothetical protein